MIDTLRDPAMIADAKKLSVDLDPVPGSQTAQMFADFYDTPPKLIEQARRVTQPDDKK